VQPNQYLKNSKTFSEQEKQQEFDPDRIEPNHKLMTLLRLTADSLRSEKVPIVDLTGIFSATTETVYKDSCCHLNDLGNQIMQEAVVGAISKTLSKKNFLTKSRAHTANAQPELVKTHGPVVRMPAD
jgi:hypothetical protein